jgi:single-stranded-DNA-specific exonuclease
MPNLNKRWSVAPSLPIHAEAGLERFPPILRQILYNRGYEDYESARAYLEAHQPPGTEPQALLGISEAVERIRYAVQNGEPVAVYGDYDVDGVTATAVLTQALQAIGAQVSGYIPNRFEEGYGLNKEALDTLYEAGVRLVITVDCGIRSLAEVAHANQLGLDVIISDHHQPGKDLPPARAIINPKQARDTYPEKELAGVGLAYKLVQALFADRSLKPSDPFAMPEEYLDLVALGTVADVAPLVGENRFLVRAGLRAIRRTRRQGLLSLIGVAGLRQERVTASDIGFILGPRLNAAGRLESAQEALELLTTSSLEVSGPLAQVLDNYNRDRQRITREMQAVAEELALQDDPEPWLLFAVHPDFNSGVVGLAASRLTDRYYRPAIVGQVGEEFTRASCRSIPEFHITEALDGCAELLERYGGHAAAAGFTVRNDRLQALAERLQEIACEQLSELALQPTLRADMEVPLSDLKPEVLEHLQWLQPTGHENPEGVFVSRDLGVARSRPVGREGAHLKLTVSDGRIYYDAIAFRQGHWQEKMPASVDLLYTFEENEYNGRTSLQLNVRDLKPSGEPD